MYHPVAECQTRPADKHETTLQAASFEAQKDGAFVSSQTLAFGCLIPKLHRRIIPEGSFWPRATLEYVHDVCVCVRACTQLLYGCMRVCVQSKFYEVFQEELLETRQRRKSILLRPAGIALSVLGPELDVQCTASALRKPSPSSTLCVCVCVLGKYQ